MVEADIDDQTRTGRIVLRPNASWTWQRNLYLLYTLMAVSLTVGVGFLFMGAWVILPYSLLELALLTVAIYYCVRQCQRQEVITVSEHEVQVQRGTRTPTESWRYHRVWARFMVKPPRHPWDPAIVSIRSHGEELELGSFLNQGDKTQLIALLKRVVPA